MNERFDALIYESGLIAHGCWDKFDDYDKQALNKFAELVFELGRQQGMRQEHALWELASTSQEIGYDI